MADIFNTGPALDPATAGLLSAAFGALQNSGPSLMPRSLGQTMGAAGQQGLNTFLQTRQSNAVLGLEQQKAALLQAQVANAQRQQAVAESILPEVFPGLRLPSQSPQPGIAAPSVSPALNTGVPSASPAVPVSAQPPAPMTPPAPSGGPLASLPNYARQAIGLNAVLPGSGSIVMQANQPVVGRGEGIFTRGPNGEMVLDPQYLEAQKKIEQNKRDVANANEVVSVELANGQKQQMTKADQLAMVAGTNQVKNMMPWASDTLVSSVQRQMLADPNQDVTLNINGHQLVVPSLNKTKAIGSGMPGVTTGQSTEARSAQEKSGTEAGGVQADINKEADNALASRRILGEMRVLAQDFTPSKIAPFQKQLGEWAQALNLPGDWSKEIEAAGSQQALQKLTAQMATAAMKQFTNRGTQMEFKTFLANNPNAELTPGGFQKVLEFMDHTADLALQKQQAYQQWRQTNPVEKSQDFLGEWNKKVASDLTLPSGKKATPSKGDVVDGWEYVGGDPANRMSWRKK